jgi:CBS domain containing-hemolysin-like protein
METLLFVILALALVVLNGFFVAAEFGMVRLRSTRIRAIAKRHGVSGRILARVHGQLDAYLSACQLGGSRSHLSALAGSASRHLPACWRRCSICWV